MLYNMYDHGKRFIGKILGSLSCFRENACSRGQSWLNFESIRSIKGVTKNDSEFFLTLKFCTWVCMFVESLKVLCCFFYACRTCKNWNLWNCEFEVAAFWSPGKLWFWNSRFVMWSSWGFGLNPFKLPSRCAESLILFFIKFFESPLLFGFEFPDLLGPC